VRCYAEFHPVRVEESPLNLSAFRSLLYLAVTGYLLGSSPPAGAALSRGAEQQLAKIQATKAGVDSTSSFWAWNSMRRVITRITPNGDRYESDILPEAIAVDLDPQRGVALLTGVGRLVTITDWAGKQQRVLHLLNQASDVAWLSGSRVAVVTQMAPHRVEIWDVATGEHVADYGPCPQIVAPRPGAVAARAPLIRYDIAHQEIITFDTYYGDMVAFTEAGTITRQGHVLYSNAAAMAAWMKQVDDEARRKRESRSPVIQNYPAMTIASDRTIWLGEDSDSHSVTSVKILPDGSVERATMDVPQCPSIRFTIWNDTFVFFRDPASPQAKCVAVRRKK
jgi:WD40 repeat protein